MIHSTPAEVDVLGPSDGENDHGSLEMGTVGWDDGTDYFDQGGAANEGNTLVKVQLFRGRDPATTLKPGVGQGHKIVCQVSSMAGIYWIPPQGTRVLVAIPAGMGDTIGAALIVGAYANSPAAQFKQNRVMWDPGPTNHVLIKAPSATLQSYSSPAQYVSVGTPMNAGSAGVYAFDETGTGVVIQSGVLGLVATDGNNPATANAFVQLKSGEVKLATGGGIDGATWSGGNVTMFGTNFYAYTAGTYLGALAVQATAALYMLAAVPTPSTTVYISP